MSVITFQCYACNQVLQVGAVNAGRKAKCSQCGTLLTIPALAADAGAVAEAAPPRPASTAQARIDNVEVVDDRGLHRREDYDDDPPRRSRRDFDGDLRRPAASKWDRVRIGFLLTFIGLCVSAGAFGLVFLAMLVSLLGTGGTVILVFMRIGLVIGFIGTIGTIVGHVFWLFVSNRRGAMGFAIAALSVAGVYLIMQIVHMAQLFGPFFRVHELATLLTYLLRAAQLMMIAFYLRALAQTFDDRRLERAAMLNIILGGCVAGYDLLAGVIAMAMVPTNPFEFGRGYVIMRNVLYLLGAALAIVVYVFTILAVFRGKRLVADAE